MVEVLAALAIAVLLSLLLWRAWLPRQWPEKWAQDKVTARTQEDICRLSKRGLDRLEASLHACIRGTAYRNCPQAQAIWFFASQEKERRSMSEQQREQFAQKKEQQALDAVAEAVRRDAAVSAD